MRDYLKSLVPKTLFLLGVVTVVLPYFVLTELKYRSKVEGIEEKQREVSTYLATAREGRTSSAEVQAFKQNYEQITNQRFLAIYPGGLWNNGIPPVNDAGPENLELRLVRAEVTLGSLSNAFQEYKDAQLPVWLTAFIFPLGLLFIFELFKPLLERYGRKVDSVVHSDRE